MAHGLKDCIVELDRPGDEQGGVGCLVGHAGLVGALGRGLLPGDGLGLVVGYAIAVGVFKVAAALGGERSVEDEGRFVVELFRQKIEAGICRRCT